jgi:hypothetical protein
VKHLDFEFINNRYDFELTRKESLTDALTFPVGVLSGLGSVIGIMARGFTYRDSVLDELFAFAVTGSGCAFVGSLILLARAFVAQTYVHLPTLNDLETAVSEFDEFNTYVESIGGEVEETFEDDLRKRIIEAADRNSESNERRARFLHWGRVSLLWLLGFTAATGFVYVIDQVRFVMPTPQAPKPTTASPAAAPQKPSFPENRVIREGREPRTSVKK